MSTPHTDATTTWAATRIVEDQKTRYMPAPGRDFIDDDALASDLEHTREPDPAYVRDIIAKARAIETLTTTETAALLHVTDPQLSAEMEQAALDIKKKVYDNRIVTFAPLYMSSTCVNNCLYCCFRRDNTHATRRVLQADEIRRETEVLAGTIGHKRLIVVYGEHPDSDIEYMLDSIRTIYDVSVPTAHGHGRIRRVNVNAPPLSIEELQRLHEVGIGTYQVFQETYHHATYARVHPRETIKHDYAWRLYSMHRAFDAGVDDVGIGALFGLYDWRFEVLGLVAHARELERAFGIGPHTISFPRLEPAYETPFADKPAHKVDEASFRRAIVALRLAVPYTGMILTAREPAHIRRALIPLGITQTDASTRIGLGAYSEADEAQQGKRQQFMLGDTRSLDEMVYEFTQMGYITSFCTAGYRCGRTGKCIMDLLRSGKEGKFCKLNAVLTFREWLDDFATEKTKHAGEALIQKELDEIERTQPAIKDTFMEYYRRIAAGERDLYL
jgi:2-iminoacetate synthase